MFLAEFKQGTKDFNIIFSFFFLDFFMNALQLSEAISAGLYNRVFGDRRGEGRLGKGDDLRSPPTWVVKIPLLQGRGSKFGRNIGNV